MLVDDDVLMCDAECGALIFEPTASALDNSL